jgi:hypothetical protein
MSILGEQTTIEIIGVSLSMLILVILLKLDDCSAWRSSKLLELYIIIIGPWSQGFG